MSLEKLKAKVPLRRAKIPPGVISFEPQSPPPAPLVYVIDRFDRGWAEQGRAPRTRMEWGACNIVPDIFSFIAADEGRRHGFDLKPRQYQLQDLHAAAGGLPDQAFRHGFNTATVEGQTYLVDLSFSQFLGDTGKLQWGSKKYTHNTSGTPNDNPLAQELITRGYVPLTNENLQEYLRVTSYAEDRSYVSNMNAELLNSVTPRPTQLSDQDGIGRDYGLS